MLRKLDFINITYYNSFNNLNEFLFFNYKIHIEARKCLVFPLSLYLQLIENIPQSSIMLLVDLGST